MNLSRQHIEHIVAALFVCALIVLDQWSKDVVFTWVEQAGGPVSILPSLNFVTVWNYGISFGMLQIEWTGKFVFSGLALGISMILFKWFLTETSFPLRLAIVSIIAGAVGNVIDRFRFGAVKDFIDVYVGEYHWPAFNVADSAVCVGVAILILAEFLPKRRSNRPKADQNPEISL